MHVHRLQHFVDGTYDTDWPGFDKDVHELTGGIPRAVMVALLGLDVVLRQGRTLGTVRPGNNSPFAEAVEAIGDAGVSSAAHRRQVLHQMFVAIRTTIPTNVFVPASASLAKQQYWLTMCYCALFNTPVALTTKAAVGWVHSLPLFGDIADDGQSIKLRLPGVAVRYIKGNYLSVEGQYLAALATLPDKRQPCDRQPQQTSPTPTECDGGAEWRGSGTSAGSASRTPPER